MRLNQTHLTTPGTNATGYLYVDATAMYTSGGALTDPENSLSWALRDASGNPVYIAWGNPPTQISADPTNADWQTRLLEYCFGHLHGTWGLEIDDVNFTLDSLTAVPMLGGQPATDQTWAAAMVSFMQVMYTELKRVMPNLVIIHNTPWYKSNPADWPYTDLIMKEFGFLGDSGLTGGTGPWSISAVFDYCDRVHAAGKGILLLESDSTSPDYSLACALMMTDGSDYFVPMGGGNVTWTPPSYAYSDWGSPLGPRYRHSSGLWERRFEKLIALALEPGAAAVTIGTQTLQPKQGLLIPC